MATITVTVERNLAGRLADMLPTLVDRAVREQVFQSEADVKVNVQKYDVIDTGNLLGSVKGRPTGHAQGEATVSAQSEQGYPYPRAQNYGWHDRGGNYHPGRPFFSEAETKAAEEFPQRVARAIEGAG